jgi:hypothetical protein
MNNKDKKIFDYICMTKRMITHLDKLGFTHISTYELLSKIERDIREGNIDSMIKIMEYTLTNIKHYE